jgi:zinc protease
LKNIPVPEEELMKVKNKLESIRQFSEMNVLNKAMGLAFAEIHGDVNMVNSEIEFFQAVTSEEIQSTSNSIFKQSNCSVLHYLAKQTKKSY